MLLTEEEAVLLQNKLKNSVITCDEINHPVRIIAGVDVCYNEEDNIACASIVIFDKSVNEIIESEILLDKIEFPYTPGIFSFREIPPLEKLLKKIKNKPDVIICDGQGLAHPRRFGMACHLGVVTGYPTIGCAKKRLTGTYDEPGDKRGDYSFLYDGTEVIGSALRTQNGVKPVFVSIGHKLSLETCCKIVLEQANKYRIPEVIRLADQMGRRK